MSPVRPSALLSRHTFHLSGNRSCCSSMSPRRVQDAATVTRDDAAGVGTRRRQEPVDGHVGGADPDERDPDLADRLLHDLQRVAQRSDDDGGGPLLIVVPDGDRQAVAQPVEHLEARRLRDVLEVDPAKGRLQCLDDGDQLVGRRGVDADRHRIDAAQVLEEQRLALHHGQAGFGPDVAEPEHSRAVGHDRDRVGPVGVRPHRFGIGRDRAARRRDARRVPDGEVLQTPHRALRHDLHLAPVVRVEAQCLLGRALGAPLGRCRLHDSRVPAATGARPEANVRTTRRRAPLVRTLRFTSLGASTLGAAVRRVVSRPRRAPRCSARHSRSPAHPHRRCPMRVQPPSIVRPAPAPVRS